MRRAITSVLRAQEASVESSVNCIRGFTNYAFSSFQDAPTSSLSSSVSVTAKAVGKGVEVKCSAGGATASAKYSQSDIRKLQGTPTSLVDVARVSVLHSSLMEYLLSLSHERFEVLSKFPDFTTMYGKDYYYRAHPDDLKQFYGMIDEFHRMYDVVTEFNSLASLATELVPAARARRMNTIHPGIGPSVANGAVTQFIL